MNSNFGCRFDVVDAPVGADRALIARFPRLVERFHDVVALVLFLGARQEAAQEQRLVRTEATAPARMRPSEGQPISPMITGFFGIADCTALSSRKQKSTADSTSTPSQ